MQISFRHKENLTATFVKYGSKRHEKLKNNPQWECLVKLSDSERSKLDADIERKKEARAQNSVGELFKKGGARIVAALQGRFPTIDDILDSTPEQISEVSGLPLSKAQNVYANAKAYMDIDV